MRLRMPKRLKPETVAQIAERFFSYVKVSEDPSRCWLWIGHTNPDHGRISVNGKMLYAHRVSYCLAYGEIRPGVHILHRCANGRCVNPTHLYAGDNSDNVLDRILHREMAEAGADPLDWL